MARIITRPSSPDTVRAKLLAFALNDRGGTALHYALIASGIGLAVINGSHHTGEKVNAQLEAVLSAMQKQGGLQRLLP